MTAHLPDVGMLLPSIMEGTPLPVWVVSADGTALYANPAALRLLGYTDLREIAGKPSHALLHPTHPDGTIFPAADCHMLDPVSTGTPIHGHEEWFRHTDGFFIPVSWSSAPIDLPSGRGVIHSFVDLTERFELERERRERELAELRNAETKAAHLRLMASIAAARRDIVRDLHDGAQQRLVGVTLQARLLEESLGKEITEEAAALLSGLAEDAQSAIDEMRELVAGIHPPILTSRGLVAAVRSYADRCAIPVIITDGLAAARLPSLIESNVYFLIAEAITNAVKHSQATRIEIDLSLDEQLVVTIADNGIGGVSLADAGSGLHSMLDRVHAFDGTVDIDSPQGAGTRIRAEIPVGQLSK